MVENIAWCLPRPSKSKYRGSFPLHFEERLTSLLNYPEVVVQPFGGKAKFGFKVDIKEENVPDKVADAHSLPYPDNHADLVLIDPPFSDEYSEELFGTDKINLERCIEESTRICKEGGFVVVYHIYPTGSHRNLILEKRILIETRLWHKIRCCHVFRKDTLAYLRKGKSVYDGRGNRYVFASLSKVLG